MICLALTGKTLMENLESIERYRTSIQLCELRADFLEESELAYIRDFPSRTDLPLILTIRRKIDGGHWAGSESERVDQLKNGLLGKYRMVDLEEDLPVQEWESEWLMKGGRIIRSFHDFDSVPENLTNRIRGLPKRPGEIPKAAVTPANTLQLLRIFRTAAELEGQEKVLLGMGDVGIPTRILSRRIGSMFTFCSPSGTSAAPGHLDPDTMENIYRFSKIDENTRLFGIIGKPVMHTKSPHIHNGGYEKAHLNCLYVPFEIDEPRTFLEWAGDFGFEGFSVTVPHKETVIPLLKKKDRGVEATGSCNTLVFRDGGLDGFNTDIPGFLAPLEEIWGSDGFSGKRAAVLGAGGAARAVVYALVSRGAEVKIYNRTTGRAEKLAELFETEWGGLSEWREIEEADLIVQTTIIGMTPHYPGNPLPDLNFRKEQIVYEIIYSPETTELLARAAESGCRTIGGMSMLIAQGYEQYRLFTGMDYPG